jgi:hypothetical protein
MLTPDEFEPAKLMVSTTSNGAGLADALSDSIVSVSEAATAEAAASAAVEI